jgi:hypothetical protein
MEDELDAIRYCGFVDFLWVYLVQVFRLELFELLALPKHHLSLGAHFGEFLVDFVRVSRLDVEAVVLHILSRQLIIKESMLKL